MTRQHFQFIADQFKANIGASNWPEGCEREMQTVKDMAVQFADALRATNPGFNRERFLTACGL